MIERADLDHVAVAVEQWTDAWPRFAVDLGGEWVSGGAGPGFSPMQIRYANGMKVEVIAPHRVDVNDFLRRFIDRSGTGPHHLTFKVADINQAIDAARSAGYEPINIDLSDPGWKEAFLHPKQATGVVVQVAQAAQFWRNPPPPEFPTERRPPAELVHVAHGVATLDDGLRLFAGLLGGTEVGRGDDEASRWVDLAWPGPGRVRLLEPTSPASPIADWLGDRAGRVHHVRFACEDPATIAGVRPLADGTYELPPDEASGVRLILA